MNRTSISLLLFGVVCAVAIVWFDPGAEPAHPIPVPAGTKSGGPVSDETSTAASDLPGTFVPSLSPSATAEPEFDSLLSSIRDALASTESETRDAALANLLPALVLRDPRAASRFAEANSIPGTRAAVLDRVARLWAAQDPAAAFAWATQMPAPTERENAITNVCHQVAEQNPAYAVELRKSLLAKDEPYSPLEDLTLRWANKDMSGLLTWISDLPPDQRRDELIGRVTFVYTQTAPQDAAKFVLDKMTPGDGQIEAAISVLYQWAKKDPAAATAWAQQFPDGALRERAMRELVLAQEEAAANPQ